MLIALVHALLFTFALATAVYGAQVRRWTVPTVLLVALAELAGAIAVRIWIG
jgi:hypothetical protein